MTSPSPRPLGHENWIGVWTLYVREVRRILKVSAQTIAGPVVTTLLFMIVLSVAVGRRAPEIEGMVYLQFLCPGLIMMAMAQNAFANTSSSILIGKVQGNIVDFLMAPLSAAELTVVFALGGITRGLVVGIAVGIAVWPFAPFSFFDPAYALFHALTANLLLALLGILGGLWSRKMDQLGAMTSFVITPLTFLSGTFYSIADLPAGFQAITHVNPFFYMIDGFRYGITGHADGSLMAGLIVMAASNITLGGVCYWLISTGWRLRS